MMSLFRPKAVSAVQILQITVAGHGFRVCEEMSCTDAWRAQQRQASIYVVVRLLRSNVQGFGLYLKREWLD